MKNKIRWPIYRRKRRIQHLPAVKKDLPLEQKRLNADNDRKTNAEHTPHSHQNTINLPRNHLGDGECYLSSYLLLSTRNVMQFFFKFPATIF